MIGTFQGVHGTPFILASHKIRPGMITCILAAMVLLAFLIVWMGDAARAEIIGRDDRKGLPYGKEAQLEGAIGILVYRIRDDKGRLLKKTGFCTATCVAPHLVLTAAHCVMRVRGHTPGTPDLGTMRFVLWPGDETRQKVLDLAGFPVDAERRKLILAGPGNVTSFNGANANDWALVPLAKTSRCPARLRMRPVDVGDRRLRHGKPLMLLGYHGDLVRRGVMHLRYSLCHVQADDFARKVMRREQKRSGKPVLVHDCDATKGASGSPMLVKNREGKIRIVAVVSGDKKFIRAWRNRKTGRIEKRRLLRAVNVAAPVENIIPALKRLKAQRAAEREKGKISPHAWQEWLMNSVGLLLVNLTRPDGTRGARACTAVCVGPHHVATAAQCVGLGENTDRKFHTERMYFILRPHLGKKGAIRLIASGDDFYQTRSAIVASGVKGAHATPANSWVILRLARGRGRCPTHLRPVATPLPPGKTLRAYLVGLETCALKRVDLRVRPVECRVRAPRRDGQGDGKTALELRCAAPIPSSGHALVVKDARGRPRLLGIRVPEEGDRYCTYSRKAWNSSTGVAAPARNFARALQEFHPRKN